jgi:hypothetical protein
MKKSDIADLERYAADNNLNFEELVEGIKLIQKHRTIIAKSANKLADWQGDNFAPTILGAAILTLLQLSVYDDPEYLHSAIESLRDIYAQAIRDNASASEMFEIMAQTSFLDSSGSREESTDD